MNAGSKRAPRRAMREDFLDAEGLLRIFASIQHPLRRDDLLRIGGLKRRDKRQLEKLLSALDEDGRIVRTPSGAWVPAERLGSAAGRFHAHSRGGGFVTPDVPLPRAPLQSGNKNTARRGGPERKTARADIFIHPARIGDARHGDKVRVLVLPGARGKSPEGRIVEILERDRRELAVRVLHKLGEAWLCRAVDPRLNLLFRTDVSALSAAPRAAELLLVLPGERLASDLWAAEARVSCGLEEDAAVQERLVKLNHRAPAEFSPRALAEAAALPAALGPEELRGRRDLTGFPFVTVDGSAARDFDDAIFVSRSGRGFRLHVAIADVTHYVRPGTALDAEARERGNSWYFPLSVEPMLPPALSNDLCSLNPGMERPALVMETDFDGAGRPKESRFYPARIRSAARLTYEQAQDLLEGTAAHETAPAAGGVSPFAPETEARRADEGGGPPFPRNEKIRAALKDAAALAALLSERRAERGGLDFELPEAEYEFDETCRIRAIRRKKRLFSHRLIEECMIAANEATARFLEERGLPVPYRVHPAPDSERLGALFRSLRTVECAQKLPQRPTAGDLPAFLRAARKTPQEFLVGRLCLRAMMQAVYQPENAGHFGLASQAYCHATSPIRRYADILVHRAIKHALGFFSGPLVAGGKLTALSDQLSRLERAAADAEREIARRLAALLLAERVGESFDAVISSVQEFGFFAEFEAMPVEGLVRLTDLTDDFYEFDPDRRLLLGRGTGRRFGLGQKLRVVLHEVHMGRLEINLTPESSSPAAPPRRGGRKANGFSRTARKSPQRPNRGSRAGR